MVEMERPSLSSRGTPGAYGGYFTKEDIREIVTYAAERHITVIPEIEFPAHSDAVFIGYPELCCTGKPYTTGEFLCRQRTGIYFYGGCAYRSYGAFPFEIHPYRRRRGPESRLGDLSEMPRP